jgi:hypothetical protein
MSIDIDNDDQLWCGTGNITRVGRDNRDARFHSDFYDEYARNLLWPNTFAKSYNEEIDKENMLAKTKDQINPDHYQGIVGDYQYIECMEFILGYQGLKAHLLGQIYKYLMRMGKKDNELQETRKVVWYTRCLEILQRDGTIIGKLGELK